VQESDENKNYKRITDFTEEGKEPTVQDSWHLARLAHNRINELKVDHDLLSRAFLKDDLNTPDYDGHRKSHKKFQDAENLVQDYKISMTKDVLKMVVGFIIGILVIGFTTYLKS
jgi:uncharacterized membrane protein